jgi:hypothetical protein
MGLHTRDLLTLLSTSLALDQGHVYQYGQHHRRRWDGGQAFVAGDLLAMPAQVQADLPLDDPVDQHANNREPRQGSHPFGRLEPHASDGRRVLDPPNARFHGGRLVLIGLEHRGSRACLRGHRRGAYRPPLVFCGVTQHLDLHHHAIARRARGSVCLRWPSSTGAARGAGLGSEAIADRVIPPRARPAPSASLPPARIRGDGGLGIGPAGEPPGVHLPHVGCHGLGCPGWGGGIGLGVRRRPWTRIHDDTPQGLRGDPSIAVFDLDLAPDAWSMPAAGRCCWRPPRCLHSQGPGGLLRSPGVECLAHGTGARDSGAETTPWGQTEAEGAATIGLTIRHHPTHPVHAQRQTRLKREGRVDTITAVAIPQADAEGQATIPAHPQTEEHRLEGVAAIWALPVGRVGGLRTLGLVRLRPVEPHGRGVLRQPGRRDRLDRYGVEGDGAQHLVALGRPEGLEEVPPPIIIEGGPRAPWLQSRHHPALFPPLPHRVEGMMPVQNGQHQGVDPTPTREPMGRVGREEAVDTRGDLQASSYTKNQRPMGHRMHLLYGHGHDAPPVGALTRQHQSPGQSHGIAGGALRLKTRVVQPHPLNLGWNPCPYQKSWHGYFPDT